MPARAASLVAAAKLNLRLLVGPVGPDGYHPVRSLMVELDGLSDTVEVRRDTVRRVACPGVAERENLAWKALDVLEVAVGRSLPCAVTIAKRIPARAGLGGGSSDAAATLHGANRVHGLGLAPADLEHIAAQVGSDVPFFIRGGVQWATGRGERLAPAVAPDFAAVIVKPAIGLSTAEVYRAFDLLPAPPAADQSSPPGDGGALAGWVRNDLWPAACRCAPELPAIAERLSSAGAGAVLLCGSGSALAGIVATAVAADEVAGRCDDVVAVVRPRRRSEA